MSSVSFDRFQHNYSLCLYVADGYWELVVWRHWRRPHLNWWPTA